MNVFAGAFLFLGVLGIGWVACLIKNKSADRQQTATKPDIIHIIETATCSFEDINIFLENLLAQIVDGFKGDAGFIFTRDSEIFGDKNASFKLQAGNSHRERLSDQQITTNLSKVFLVSHLASQSQPIHPADLFRNVSEKALPGRLLTCPILIDDYLHGVICLYRPENFPFTEADIHSLEIITEKLSWLFSAEQQHKKNISQNERNQLSKDLHDTVTQQLYGALYQVETLQAQIELGQTDLVEKNLEKLGDIIRQTLRETRLISHELQHTDIKEIGLITAIHQRLIAVEGRANISCEFKAPETLSLSTQQELNLYKIIREALNNILRHAKAKQITITLKEDAQGIHLEIQDDGIGFRKTSTQQEQGMGIKNIHEWAAQIQATVEILSAHEKGTQINITILKANHN